jgi:prepilin peptidase CpaA
MLRFHWDNWPLLVICTGMIASAGIDWWKFKVPNRLTFPLILSGWALGLAHNVLAWWPNLVPETYHGGVGGLGASLAATALGFVLLLPVYAIGGMGAGDVKMTMGFGAWAGAYFGLEHGRCLWVVADSFCAGVIIGGFIALVMIMLRGQYRSNIQNTREIVGDLFTSSGLQEVAARAQRRRSRWHRLPYGVPLCIGFVGYLVWAGWQTPPAPQPTPDAQVVQIAPLVQFAPPPAASVEMAP